MNCAHMSVETVSVKALCEPVVCTALLPQRDWLQTRLRETIAGL